MKLNAIFGKLVAFLKEVQIEVKKVNWPTRNEVVRFTLIILGTSLIVAAFLGAFDFLFQTFLNKIILR